MDDKWTAFTLVGLALSGAMLALAVNAFQSPEEKKIDAFKTCVQDITSVVDNKELAVESCKQVAGMAAPR